jgi:hypothetical protein
MMSRFEFARKLIRGVAFATTLLFAGPAWSANNFWGLTETSPGASQVLQMKSDFSLSGNLPGGVTFVEKASMTNGQPIRIAWDATSVDGHRLAVHSSGMKFTFPVYDWVLVPIARVVATDHDALIDMHVVTQQDPTTGALFDVINFKYHTEVANTPVGVRLAHLDMLILWPGCAEIPKNQFFPGESKSTTTVKNMATSIMKVGLYWERLDEQSYTVTDHGARPLLVANPETAQMDVIGTGLQWKTWSQTNLGLQIDSDKSRKLTASIIREQGLQPTVFQTCSYIAKLSALLRLARSKMGESAYSEFVKSLPQGPKAETPNSLKVPNSPEVPILLELLGE